MGLLNWISDHLTLILGISAFYHDSAAVLLRDGEVVAAASEERFTRKKHDSDFPRKAMRACLDQAGASVADLDFVGFYEKPLQKFDRLLETYLAYAPRGYLSFAKAIPTWLQTKLRQPTMIRQELGREYRKKLVFCEHHESHAASAFYPSPFEDAAILTVDGVGEWATTTWGVGRGNKIELRNEIRFPHSLGLLYSAFTYFCGFRVNSGEYKLMGLAPYGEPKFTNTIREDLITVHDDGSYRLNMEYFTYCHTLRMTGRKMQRLLGVPRREPDTPVREVDMDIAASIQQVTEEVVLKMAQHVHAETGLESLCMAGGVALNCVANGKLKREGPFENIWVQPAAGDAGGALGVASLIWHQLLEKPRSVRSPDSQFGSLLGTEICDAEIESLITDGAVAAHYDDKQLFPTVAKLLAGEKVVGWVQQRMEFGPRALGSRSILGDPRSPEMQTTMNVKIKFRESFRPFAPAILEEKAHEYFEVSPSDAYPYMLFTHDVQESRRLPIDESVPRGIERVKQLRSDLPAITHLDYSARVQTVGQDRHPRFHALLKAFQAETHCPCLINTSFNVRGEPIVRTAEDAYRCFMATHMDALVIGNHVFLREEQPVKKQLTSEDYLTNLEPD